MSAVADGVGCGLCAPAARGRGRESGEGRGQQRESTGQRDSIADGTALRNTVGEEVAATFGDTEDLFPEGSLFMSLRASGYLLTIFFALNCPSKKRRNGETTARRERSEHLIRGG